jgi:hypothetical protein
MPPMPTPPAPPLVFVQPLAGPDQRLAALHWRAGPGDMLAALPWLQGDDWVHLASNPHCPCLWDQASVADWPAPLRDALAASGAITVEREAIAWRDTRFADPTPPPGPWVAGPWYLQPPRAPSAAQTASRAQALKLLELVVADADTREIEDVLRQDARLSYHLLRLVNSAAMGSQRSIGSFSQAILMLGRKVLKRWLHLMLFAASDGDDRAHMLTAHVTLRARAMELLAHEAGLDKPMQDQAFMAGMFSRLDVLLGLPTEAALQPLRLTDELQAALLRREGPLGQLLRTWEAAENADAPTVHRFLAEGQLPHDRFNVLTTQACAWMLQVTAAQAGASGHD